MRQFFLRSQTRCYSFPQIARLEYRFIKKGLFLCCRLHRDGLCRPPDLKAARIALKDALSFMVSVESQVSAGVLVFIESSRNLTLSASESPDFMRIVRSILFIKSCGSWSSGLPVKNIGVVSVISSLSKLVLGLIVGDLWRVGRVKIPSISCGVQVASDSLNREEPVGSGEPSVSSKSSNSELLLVSGV